MFSEYASRFLAQSQSRVSSLGSVDNNTPDRQRSMSRPKSGWQGRDSHLGGRSYLDRGAASPYRHQGDGSRFGHLGGFGSRYASHDAPLFRATLEHEDEDDEERDRESADLFALQPSRRGLAAGHLEESTENEDDGSRGSLDQSPRHDNTAGPGIRSSCKGAKSIYRREPTQDCSVDEAGKSGHARSPDVSTKADMHDIGLESTTADRQPPSHLMADDDGDRNPPASQGCTAPHTAPARFKSRRYLDHDAESSLPRPASPADIIDGAVDATRPPHDETFRHDPFFAYIFLIAQAALVSTSVLVYLHTTAEGLVGDTIYTTLRASFDMLAVDTVVSVLVSLVWLAALRSFVRPLVFLVVFAVPVILASFSLYPLVSSYQTRLAGHEVQDVAMRWAAVVPAASAAMWVFLVYSGRHALASAIRILEFSSRVLAANAALLLVAMGCLAAVVLWTWIWLAMFTRVFLGGYFSTSRSKFIVSASSWWLGIYFFLMYIWTISVIAGVQRAATSATVSQWYFHRNQARAPSSREIVMAAVAHSMTTIFGTISLSALLALAVRLPLLILPKRVANVVSLCSSSFVPAPIAALTNPLALTYAAIHSSSLAESARGLNRMDFLASSQVTTILTPDAVSARRRHSPLLAYRVAKLILHATRFIMATALGFAGWIMAARQLSGTLPNGLGFRGSAYAYVVGLVAGFIGWAVLGAMEGILSGIVDAVLVCYTSEKRMVMAGGGYCMEAAALFGGGRHGKRRDGGL